MTFLTSAIVVSTLVLGAHNPRAMANGGGNAKPSGRHSLPWLGGRPHAPRWTAAQRGEVAAKAVQRSEAWRRWHPAMWWGHFGLAVGNLAYALNGGDRKVSLTLIGTQGVAALLTAARSIVVFGGGRRDLEEVIMQGVEGRTRMMKAAREARALGLEGDRAVEFILRTSGEFPGEEASKDR